MRAADARSVALAALGAGFAGWLIENAAQGKPRYSRLAPSTPLLPVYAAGGALVALIAPSLSGRTLSEKMLVYGVMLTTLEGAAGMIERMDGRESWDYHGSVVDPPHALAWALLGTLLGEIVSP